jgi:hypothetical protein
MATTQNSVNNQLNNPSNIIGVTNGSFAAIGSVGELIFSVISTSVSITTGVVSNLTSISLRPGDWDIWGNINYPANGTTNLGNTAAWISTTSATPPNNAFYAAMPSVGVSSSAVGFTVPGQPLNVTAPTTVYLSQVAVFTLSTQTIVGTIYARCRR